MNIQNTNTAAVVSQVTNTQTTPSVDNYQSLSSSAILVELSIGQSTGRKKDKAASVELCNDKGAKRKAAAVHKQLFGDCEELEAIQKCVSLARRIHEEMTLPWGKLGQRMLTTVKQPDYIKTMTGLQNQFHDLVDAFGDVHPTILINVHQELGDLYDPNDYEPWDTLKTRYRFNIQQWSMPDTGDIRLDLPREALEQMKADMQTAIQENLVAANTNLWERVRKVCTNMSNRLDYGDDETKKRFNDTLVTNVEGMVELLRSLNVTNDPQMVKVSNRIEDTLRGVTPDALREDSYMRSETKREIDDVLASLPNLDI